MANITSAKEAVIPKGFYNMGTVTGKKAWEGHITPDKEYTLINISGGNYTFLDDNGEIACVDVYGGWFY